MQLWGGEWCPIGVQARPTASQWWGGNQLCGHWGKASWAGEWLKALQYSREVKQSEQTEGGRERAGRLGPTAREHLDHWEESALAPGETGSHQQVCQGRDMKGHLKASPCIDHGWGRKALGALQCPARRGAWWPSREAGILPVVTPLASDEL